ncbi:MAG: type II toxin-antitoxin system RelE/ParE family toxin [Nannocystaceae bacterium]
MLLPIHPEALIELDHAMTWHERERTGTGLALLDEVSARVEHAASFPHSGSPLVGFEARHDVRKYVVRRFRYVVITALVNEVLTVVAVAHTSREPGYWRNRLV